MSSDSVNWKFECDRLKVTKQDDGVVVCDPFYKPVKRAIRAIKTYASPLVKREPIHSSSSGVSS